MEKINVGLIPLSAIKKDPRTGLSDDLAPDSGVYQ
jgi:hypothetical protein